MKTLKPAFTLVDLLLVLGLILVLLSLSTLSILRVQNKPSLDGAIQRLAADIKYSQNQAMVGDSGNSSATTTWGVKLSATGYTLFKGASYSAGDSSNFNVTLDSNIALSTDINGSVISFIRRSGEVNSYNSAAKTITLTNNASHIAKTITIGRYGSLVIN